MLLSFPIFAVFLFFPKEVIDLVYGSQYGEAVSVLRILAVAYFGHTMVGFTAVNLVAAGMTRVQFGILRTSLFVNIAACFVLVPQFGIIGAAFASLLSLWTLNGLCLVIMWRRLGIQPFTRLYWNNLFSLLAIAAVTSSVFHMTGVLPAVASLFSFSLICLGSIGMLYRLGALIDVADRQVIAAAFEACIVKLRKKEPIYDL
jgi:O-antigen/teichoic acid export membrane protein